MPRITFHWPEREHFRTDCLQIARIFLRSPDSFQPRQSRMITTHVRTSLLEVLERYERMSGTDRMRGCSANIDRVSMTIEESKGQHPFR